jgi:hypothetical protein
MRSQRQRALLADNQPDKIPPEVLFPLVGNSRSSGSTNGRCGATALISHSRALAGDFAEVFLEHEKDVAFDFTIKADKPPTLRNSCSMLAVI